MLVQREVLRQRKEANIKKQSWQQEQMDWNDIRHRSHEDILLEREESGRESKSNIKNERQQREAKQTGAMDVKT